MIVPDESTESHGLSRFWSKSLTAAGRSVMRGSACGICDAPGGGWKVNFCSAAAVTSIASIIAKPADRINS